MSIPILHHYPESLFSEKARVLLGYKQLAWQSVVIPPIMPKPDLMALTGGYRRTPVMQVGADIYCDTVLIAQVLDRIATNRPLFPAASALASQVLTRWADTNLFWACVTLRFQPAAMAAAGGLGRSIDMQAFAQDRANFSQGATVRRVPLDEANATVAVILDELSQQLGDGRAFLFGAEPVIGDFAVYHNLWFLNGSPLTAKLVSAHPKVAAWVARMAAFGHGHRSEITGADAIAIAKNASPAAIQGSSDHEDIKVGEKVEAGPADYGVMPTTGELVHCGRLSIVVRRFDERAGEVNVHFPRVNFALRRAS